MSDNYVILEGLDKFYYIKYPLFLVPIYVPMMWKSPTKNQGLVRGKGFIIPVPSQHDVIVLQDLLGGAITISKNMRKSMERIFPYIVENKCLKPPTSIHIYIYT